MTISQKIPPPPLHLPLDNLQLHLNLALTIFKDVKHNNPQPPDRVQL